MKERPHTKHEFYKLNLVRDYLREEGEGGELGYRGVKLSTYHYLFPSLRLSQGHPLG